MTNKEFIKFLKQYPDDAQVFVVTVKCCWIHLRDAVECGTIIPLEAYDQFD